MEASQALKKHEVEFFDVVNAKLDLLELKRKNVIPDSLVKEIESADDKKAKDLLFQHLHCNADVATLREYCRMAIAARAYPKMQSLGEKMLRDLPLEAAGQASGQTTSQAGAQGSDAPFARPFIIPDVIVDYIEVKGMFVGICTTQGSPTLDEVKDHCFDLIAAVSIDMPQITHQIKTAETMKELADVVCFRLSRWLSYDFFKKVITHFQPALKSVKERLLRYEDQLKPLLLKKLEYIAKLQLREEAPGSMAELTVKYRLDADGLTVKDLVAERDFLAQRLGIPEHLLQVLSWGYSSVVITYWMVRDVLPLAELALCREDIQAELIQHGVEDVYLGSHPSEHPGPVDQSLQTLHLQRRAIVTTLDAHHHDLDVPSLTSGLKGMGILTAEQCQKLASLDDRERRHEALLYTLLAHDGPDTFHKLVECVGLRDASTVADLQATFKGLVKSPGVLSVISSQYTPKSAVERAPNQVVEGVRALKLELAEAREAKERLEEDMRGLKEELERNLAEQAVAKERLEEDMRGVKEELENKWALLDCALTELQERHRSTEDEFELFKAEHADCDVSKKKQKVTALSSPLTAGIEWTQQEELSSVTGLYAVGPLPLPSRSLSLASDIRRMELADSPLPLPSSLPPRPSSLELRWQQEEQEEEEGQRPRRCNSNP